jgi:hypothetical protein
MNFLHVGYPKCGSTFLQNQYFVEENGFHNLLVHAPHEWREFIQHELTTAHSVVYSGKAPQILDKNVLEKDVGLSNENIVVSPIDYPVLLDRWAGLFPETKVLIVTRGQLDLVYSWYLQLVLAGYSRNIDQFTRELIWDTQGSIWGRMYFDRIVDFTTERFESVKVIPYELMRDDYSKFIEELNSFFDRDEDELTIKNKRYRSSPSDAMIFVMRCLNRLCPHGYGLSMMSVQPSYVVGVGRAKYNGVDSEVESSRRKTIGKLAYKFGQIGQILPLGKSSRQKYHEKYGALFSDRFRDSNVRLGDLLGRDLSLFNYPGL